MIIDCHTHLNRYTPEEPATLEARCRSLRAQMDAHGVAYALVLGSYVVNEDRPSSRALVEATAGEPRIGVIAGFRYGADRAAELTELRRLLLQGQIKGIKLYPGYEPFYVHDPGLAELYALAREFDVPIVVHTGDTYAPHARVRFAHPLELDDAAVAFPDVRFVLCHLGNPWFDDAMEVVYKNPNVFADISGLTLGAFEPRLEALLVRKVNAAIAWINDPEKLLFGSDWPISDVPSYLSFVERLELSPEEREGLLWRNAARVFRLELPTAEGAHP